MSILIIEKEAVSRLALQHFLNNDGHKVVHLAKNDVEATKFIAARKGQIRFVVADYEIVSASGSQFLKKFGEAAALHLCPFILTSSHLKKSDLLEFRNQNPCIDFHLPKPFRASKLISAMHQAALARFSLRDQLIVWTSEAGFNKFRVQNPGRSAKMKLLHVKTTAEIVQAVAEYKFKVGAILIDPDHYQSLMKDSKRDWLRSFKMTTFGALTRIVCLGDQPGIPSALRKYSDLFIPGPGPGPTAGKSTEKLFEQLQLKIAYGWFLKKLHEKCRSSFQDKDFGEARSHANKMLSIDPFNADAYALLGRLYETRNLTTKAVKAYTQANDLNPFSPQPYLGLMRTLKGPKQSNDAWAEKAVLFCPEHPDVLKAAALNWRTSGEPEKASLLTKKLAELTR